MALSEHEQKALEEMEKALIADDPDFGSGFVSSGARPSISLRGIAVAVVGLCMLVGGVALSQNNIWFVALSVVGFLVMFGAGIWMLKGSDSSPASSTPPSKTLGGFGESTGGADGKNKKAGGLGDRMEDSFRRRFDGPQY
ncbi:DUF3040 domain-containing protein [Corynebacterium mendelii]|uniref:DUF3040 domain-containing protein n=1 Tax=Corynebacterium mendelii TaxID=2765362 RepID=A0A939E045_9CORY|nr:DUF3040 domain-containing protein [Corynebacterium mendelii]